MVKLPFSGPSASWEVPDLSDKVCLVTGGNSGIGEAIVTQLAQRNPKKLYLGARSPARAQEALVRIRATSAAAANANIEVLDIDLASFESVKKAAAKVNAETDRLDVLHCHGGISSVPATVSKEGYEIQWGTNYMGHVLLTQLLMPKLLETSTMPGADVRIVIVSSDCHYICPPKAGILWDELKTDMKDHIGMIGYGQSMVGKTLFAQKLAEIYPGIITTSANPGLVATNIWNGEKSVNGWMRTLVINPLVKILAVDAIKGSRNQLWLSFGEGVENGAYYEPVAKKTESKFTKDHALADQLWEWTNKELSGHGAPGWP